MRQKTDILLAISFTILILSVIFIASTTPRDVEQITGLAAGNAEVCVGNTPSLVPIGNLTGTASDPATPFYHDVNHTGTSEGEDIIYADTTTLFVIDSSTGEISFTPENSDVGNYTVMIRVNNTACMELGDSEELNFEVVQGNRAPVLDTIGNHIVLEDNQLWINVTAIDPDEDNNITYACNTSEDAPYNQFTINETTGVIDWYPTNDDVGLNWFDCNATDDYGAYDSEIFSVTVTNVNDNPIFDEIPNFTVEGNRPLYEDESFYYDVNATDPEGDDITYTSNWSLPVYKNGEYRISHTTGEMEFTPLAEEIGNHSVIIYAQDGIGAASQVVLFEVLEVNDPPLLASIGAQTAQANSLFELDVNATDEEDGTDNLEGTGNLTFAINDTTLFNINSKTGEISFTPTEAQIGSYSFNISVTDNGIQREGWHNATNSEVISFVVTVANRPPNITSYSPETPFSMQTGESQSFVITVEDPDGGTPSAQWYDNSTPITGATSYTYTFTPSSTGDYNRTVVVTDGELEDIQEWAVTVTAPPPPPPPPGPGSTAPAGGRSGGGKAWCKELWLCTEWSTCTITDIQIRECKDAHDCGTTVLKPPEVRSCTFVPIETCFDRVLNQNEILTDCGGVCQPCPTCNDGICNQGEQCEICKEDPNHIRCPRDLEENVMPDCGGPCPLCPKIEKPLQPKTVDWKLMAMKTAKITLGTLFLLLIAAIIFIKIIRKISKKAVLTEQEKAELNLVKEINSLIPYAEEAIDTKDMANLKTICENIENLYNNLSSTKNKKKIYPKIKKLKRAIRIGF